MENAVEALKIAVSVMIFAMALTIGISSLSNANSAIDTIINLRDRETEYTYVEPTKESIRTVGIETVVTSIYRAFEENIAIYFVKADGTKPIALYYDTDPTTGKIKKDDSNKNIEITCIDLSNEGFSDSQSVQDHLDIVLGGKKVLDNKSQELQDKYENKLIYYEDGLYDYFKDAEFEEYLGEYYQEEGASKIKKRIITYRLVKLQ